MPCGAGAYTFLPFPVPIIPDYLNEGVFMYSKQDVLDFIEMEDVSFVRLAFCDVFGKQKNVSIMANELPRAFETGISFDASAVLGFGDEEKSDLFLHPDPSTLSVLPWRPSHGRVIRLYCDIRYPDGRPFELDGRSILSKAEKAAKDMGITCGIGAEYEFYLFVTDEQGHSTGVPHDNAGYMDIAPDDRGENVRREICLNLSQMGIEPECSHHEEGPGQHEIDFKYSTPLNAADNATTFKAVVKTMASINGLCACFDPKPLENQYGNGFHINISPNGSGDDIFTQFLAGILDHVKEITAFLNPTKESYKRFGHMKAPKYITWSPENRSQLIRIPAAAHPSSKRIELRSPDPLANPYLTYALVIYAGLDGIKRRLSPCEPTNANLYKAAESELQKLDKLPESLEEALEFAKNSSFVKSVLPERIIDIYCSER